MKMHNLPLLRCLTESEISNDRSINSQYDEMINDIKYNLENILNTRKLFMDELKTYPALAQSLLNYGLRDFSDSYYGNKVFQKQLCAEIAEVIAQLEPRLHKISVSITNNASAINRCLEFTIDATLFISKRQIHASFTSSLEIIKQQFLLER